MSDDATNDRPPPYRVIGTTYDGVKVLAPAVKSTRFTAAEVRRLISMALKKDATGV